MRKITLFKLRKTTYLFLCFISIPFLMIHGLERYAEQFAHFSPDYEKIDLTPIYNQETLSEEDYQILFQQTGLGKYAIDSFRNQPNGLESVLPFQESFFAPAQYRCEDIGPITKQECLIDENGDYDYGFPLFPVENGFVLATKGAHTFGWRNGHCGLVVYSDKNLCLEAITLGANSDFMDIDKWRNYPSFILLRLRDADSAKLDEIAETASQYLYDVPYRLTPGVFTDKYESLKSITGTHCSHLIWEAFRYYGYDVDSNGKRIVTVRDVVKSPLFEIVQIYGVNPENVWEP